MTIAVGDALPDVKFLVKDSEGIDTLTTADIFAGKTVALFGVPGAFTPGCHMKHLPGFLKAFDEFRSKGADTVACVSVNDPHVMRAWADATDPEGRILFLADGNAEFAKAAGLDVDISAGGMGTRLKRFSMLVRDGRVAELNLEHERGQIQETAAEKLLMAL